MPSTKLSVRAADHGLAQTIEDILSQADPGADAVTLFEDGPDAWRIEAYWEDRSSADLAAEQLRAAVGAELPAITLEDLPDLNWVAMSQAALPPVSAGRFVVHGSHDRDRVPHGPRSILIDAGEAFGTAHHETTLGCLIAIDRLARSYNFTRILDLGCGSGVLAIAAARALPSARVYASDNDPIAVDVARTNAEGNGVRHITFACTAGLAHPTLRAAAPFDLIIANILAGPLRGLAGDIGARLRPGAFTVLSGILNPEAPTVVASYLAHGFTLVERRRMGDWTTLTLRRRG